MLNTMYIGINAQNLKKVAATAQELLSELTSFSLARMCVILSQWTTDHAAILRLGRAYNTLLTVSCTWDIQRSAYIIIKGKQSSVLFNLCSYVRLQTTPGRKTRGCGGACDGAEGGKYWSMDESGGRAFGWRRFGRLERKGERCIPVRVGEGRGAGT